MVSAECSYALHRCLTCNRIVGQEPREVDGLGSRFQLSGCLILDFDDDHSDLGHNSMQSGVVPTAYLLFVTPLCF